MKKTLEEKIDKYLNESLLDTLKKGIDKTISSLKSDIKGLDDLFDLDFDDFKIKMKKLIDDSEDRGAEFRDKVKELILKIIQWLFKSGKFSKKEADKLKEIVDDFKDTLK